AMTDEPAADDVTAGEAETAPDEATDEAVTMAAGTIDATNANGGTNPWTTIGEGTMPLMRPDDFAAAEAEAATWQADEPVDPQESTTDADHDTAADASAEWPPVAASDPLPPSTTRTQVVLVGLVS